MQYFIFICSFDVGSSAQQIQLPANISTSPFLPDKVVATSYPDLKLMTQIRNTNLYFSCSWLAGSRSLATIFSGTAISCRNRTELLFKLTCVETNNVIMATATFLSPVLKDDGGLYQVQCRFNDLSDVIIAEIYIGVSGTTDTARFC